MNLTQGMLLTDENYYSPEANWEYFSASQVKSFMACEAKAMAELHGAYERPTSTSLLVGSYVDAHFSHELDLFKAQHPEIFTRTGGLRSEYQKAEEIIARLERDELAMDMLDGSCQHIATGRIGGEWFKAKLDCLLSPEKTKAIAEKHPGMTESLLYAGGAIVDLKIMKDFAPIYKPGEGKQPFIETWGYDLQMAIYQELMRQETGTKLPCFILAATKEPVTDIGLFQVPQELMDASMEILNEIVPHYADMKDGSLEPVRCEGCAWCRETKVLTEPGWPEVFA